MGNNPLLYDMTVLVGRWRMELHHASFLPDRNARAAGTFMVEWIENGVAIIMRQGDASNPPASTWIVGRDESDPDYVVLYGDDRGVSRIYRMNFESPHWTMWRDSPTFSQRFTALLDQDERSIRGRWEKSTDQGVTWEHDFNLDYFRIEE